MEGKLKCFWIQSSQDDDWYESKTLTIKCVICLLRFIQGLRPISNMFSSMPWLIQRQDASNLLIAGVCARSIPSSRSHQFMRWREKQFFLKCWGSLEPCFVKSVIMKGMFAHHLFATFGHDSGKIREKPTEHAKQAVKGGQPCQIKGCCNPRKELAAMYEM